METLYKQFLQSFQRHAQKVAVKKGKRLWTYKELWNSVVKCRKRLSALALPEQSIISFDGEPSFDGIALLIACLLEEQVLFLINRRLPDFFLQNRLKNLTVALSIGEKRLGKRHLSAQGFFTSVPAGSTIRNAPLLFEKPCTMIFTSGTTNLPKIALHSGSNHLYSALGAQTHVKLLPSSTWFLSLPLYHVAGLGIVFRTLLHGASIRIPEEEEGLPVDVTHISVIETTFRRLCASLQEHRLSCVMLGGGPISSDLVDLATAHQLPMLYTYGMTEMSSHICNATTLYRKGKAVCYGLPHSHAEVQVRNGELFVRGNARFLGYYPLKKQETFWFGTKDAGAIDEEQKVWIHGRKDRQFISGGENIQPAEIEEALLACPGVEFAQVFPKPDPTFGMCAVAMVRMSLPFDEIALKNSLKKRLPRYKIPKKIFLETGSISSLQGKFF
ncbi:MAG: AMP-binding protein [Chlamydiota bacterium]